LEAKVAAHYDRLGLRWAYEPRAYANASGQYLPDFQLLDEPYGVPIFVEVRPTLERAFLALAPMQIILDSEPDACLVVVVPGSFNLFSIAESRLWRVVV
jgi:hypothetical protein